MFRNTLLRLTLWYLLIIISLSAGFSIALYRVSTAELDANQHALEQLLQRSFFLNQQPEFLAFNQARLNQIEQSRHTIALNLLYFNLSIIIIGGAVSYILAKRTLQPLADSLESQKRFTSDASHELRTPLASMKSEIEVALRDKALTLAEAKQLLQSNLEEVDRLESLAHGLLTLATQDTIRQHAFTPCAVSYLVQQAKIRVAPQLKNRAITLLIEPTSLTVHGDEWSLIEALSILLDNAIKYSPERSEVRITTTQSGSQISISIHDQGIGISKEDLPHIFDRFYRADTSRTRTNASGYGLGLSIAKRIITLHRGSIEVTSTLGRGSTFTIIL